MAHSTRPAIDSTICLQLLTPTGYVVFVREGDIPETIRRTCDNGEDEKAAIMAARVYGLDVTIRRETQTTVRVGDIEGEG